MAFRIEFHLTGGGNMSDGPDDIAEDFIAARELAIVPRKGDMVKISKHDSYRRVDDVFLAPAGADRQIMVYLEDDEELSTEQLVAAGWLVVP